MGSGFRTFTAGEVLTASNVQNYLQDQVVMTFAGSAARSSAIGTANFEEGMVSYLTDTDKVEAYNGTNWVQVGSSNQGLTLINTTSFSAVASQSITSVFSSTYDNYRIVYNLIGSTSTNTLMRLRTSSDDSSASYNKQYLYAASTTILAARSNGQTSWLLGDHGTDYTFNTIDLIAPNLAQTTGGFQLAGQLYASGSNNWFSNVLGHTASTQFTGFTIYPASGTITGSVSVYGYNK